MRVGVGYRRENSGRRPDDDSKAAWRQDIRHRGLAVAANPGPGCHSQV